MLKKPQFLTKKLELKVKFANFLSKIKNFRKLNKLLKIDGVVNM